MLFTHIAASNLLFAASFAFSEANRPSKRIFKFDSLPSSTLETCDYVNILFGEVVETHGGGTLLGVESGSKHILFFLTQ